MTARFGKVSEAPMAGEQLPFASARILLLEEDWTHRDHLLQLLGELTALPVDVVEAEALLYQQAGRASYDLILLSPEGCDSDLRELQAGVRQVQACQDVPLVLLSDSAPGEGAAMSFAACLQKPVSAESLRAVFVSLLGGNRRQPVNGLE